MDHDVIVEPLLDRCEALIANIVQAPDLHRVAPASWAIFAQMREGARELLQAKSTLEARQRMSPDGARCCPDAHVKYVHTRAVRPETWLGQITISVRTVQCRGGGATFRPADGPRGVPEAGDFTDDVRSRYAPVVAELPHRVAHDLLQRCTGVALSSRGAQGIIDRTAEDLRTGQAVHERQETAAVEDALGGRDDRAELRLAVAMDGVMAHLDGRGQAAKMGPLLGRRLDAEAEEPPLGTILARRDSGGLGSAADLAVRLPQVIRVAGWERIPVGESLGEGAAWIWKVADAHFPGVRQTLDDYHLSEPFYDFAHLVYPHNPAGAQAWVDQKLGALLTDRIAEVWGALKRMRPWQQALCDALPQLIGYVERHRSRIQYQDPWHRGLAVGSGAVEGACKHVMHSRFKRAGMRWKPPGFLNVLALRLARLHGTFHTFWASRGLVIQTSV